MTEAECAATTIDCDLSVRKYSKIARRAKKRGGRTFLPHNKVAKYKHEKCTPRGIRTPTEHSIEVDLEDVMHHQTSKLLTPDVKQKMVNLKKQGATFVLYYKFGKLTFSFCSHDLHDKHKNVLLTLVILFM